MRTYIAEWSSIAGLIVSLIGIVVTLWVAREISKVRRAYIRRVRIPELLERFSEIVSELADYLNNFDAQINGAQKSISQLTETAKAISSKLEKKERSAILVLINQLAEIDISSIDEQKARVVYLRATAAHESLLNLNQDLIWQ
jgi:hypothetical protein